MSDVLSSGEMKTLLRICDVNQQQLDKLQTYVARLKKWQKTSNLIAPSTIEQIWTRHIADSLQVAHKFPDINQWIDLGSGGGLPAIVIAIMRCGVDDFSIDVVESNQKKCAFLRSVSRELDLPVSVHNTRIEDYVDQTPHIGKEVVVTARALASLNKLFELGYPLLSNGYGLFHKGRDHKSELRDSQEAWNFDLEVFPSQVETDSVVLQIQNLQQKKKS